MDPLYEVLPRLIPRHVFSDAFSTPVRRAMHGDSSGVLGAARLW
jgi:fructokinase